MATSPPISAPKISPSASPTDLRPPTQRYLALDAYRGFIMLTLAAWGFGFSALADDPTFGRVARWFEHVPWEGGVFWDMIQPAFMFMVGVAMPFALARRMEQGATWGANFRHVLGRSLRLLALSQILMWVHKGHWFRQGHIELQLINVLSQIAFTYFLAFLIMQWRWRYQVIAAVALLALWTAMLFVFADPVSHDPFSRTNHVGLRVDRAIFRYDYDPAYSSLNFIASTVWTLAGVWVGRLLLSSQSHRQNLLKIAAGMALSFALAFALQPWIPFIKQLCTASFILYSLGWVLVMLIGFYGIIEVLGFRKWTFPLVVVGMNSIFIYSFSELLHSWLDRAVAVFTFRYQFIGTLAPVAQACTVVLVMWYLCYWLYRRRIFLKV